MYVALVDIERRGEIKDKEIAQGHGGVLEFAVGVALFAHFLFLFDLDHELEGTNQHVEDEVAHLDVKGAREVVPVEAWRVVQEEVAHKYHTVQHYYASEGFPSHSLALVAKEAEESVP